MQKTFVKFLFISVALNLLVKPLAIFGIDAQIQNQIGTEEYGSYFALLNFSYLFSILLDLGITNYNTRNIAQFPHLAKAYIGKMLPVKAILFASYFIISIGIAILSGYTTKQLSVLGYLLIYQLLISFLLFLRSYFSGLFLFTWDIILSVSEKALLILVVGYLLYIAKYPFTIELFLQIQVCCVALSVIIGSLVLMRKIGLPTFTWKLNFIRNLLRKSLPFATLIVLMMLYSRLDSVLLERLAQKGTYESGLYAQGYRLIDALFMFASLFSGLLLPLFSKQLKDKTRPIALLKTATNVLIPGAILIGFLGFFHGNYLLQLVYHNDVEQATVPFQFMSLGFIGLCMTLLFGTLITARGDLKLLNYISLGGIVLNVISNLVLIPTYGATGAAISNLITQSAMGIAQGFYIVYTFQIRMQIEQLLKYVGLLLIVIGFQFLPLQLEMGIQVILMCASVFAYLFLSKLINLNELLGILKSD